uniref:Secreted protein n=1 Tax=Globodera pallida TaxID=36090 RepID=A0A183BZ56_GLOPA
MKKIKIFLLVTILIKKKGDWALYGECDPSLSGAQCLQFHREQSAIVVVYFEQLNYESLQESEAYGVTWR